MQLSSIKASAASGTALPATLREITPNAEAVFSVNLRELVAGMWETPKGRQGRTVLFPMVEGQIQQGETVYTVRFHARRDLWFGVNVDGSRPAPAAPAGHPATK